MGYLVSAVLILTISGLAACGLGRRTRLSLVLGCAGCLAGAAVGVVPAVACLG